MDSSYSEVEELFTKENNNYDMYIVENNNLLNENMNLKREISDLQTQLSVMDTKYKHENKLLKSQLQQNEEEYKSKVQMIMEKHKAQINQLEESNRRTANQISAHQMSHDIEIGKLQDTINTLESKIRSNESDNDNRIKTLENQSIVTKSLISKCLSKLSSYFSQQFETLNSVSDFLISQPASLKDLELRYQNSINCYKNEINNLKKQFRDKKTEYKSSANRVLSDLDDAYRSIEGLKSKNNAEKIKNEELELKVLDLTNEIDSLRQKLREKPLPCDHVTPPKESKSESYMFFNSFCDIDPSIGYNNVAYQPKFISDNGGCRCNNSHERRKRKIKKLEAYANELRSALISADIKIRSYEADIETLNMKLSYLTKQKESLEKQVVEKCKIQVPISNDQPNFGPMLDVAKRKIKRQAHLIDDMQADITRLSKENEEYSDKVAALNVHIERLKSELLLKPFTEEETSKEALPVEDANQINWDFCEQLPYDIDVKIKSIAINDSLELSSKVKHVVNTIVQFFERKLKEKSVEFNDISSKYNKIESSLTSFITELTEVTLNEQVQLQTFVDSNEIQKSVIKSILNNKSLSSQVNSLRKKLEDSNVVNESLRNKLKAKAALCLKKDSLSDPNSSYSSSLVIENQSLRDKVENLEMELKEKTRQAREEVISEYEPVVVKLREQINKQKKIINELTSQLAKV